MRNERTLFFILLKAHLIRVNLRISKWKMYEKKNLYPGGKNILKSISEREIGLSLSTSFLYEKVIKIYQTMPSIQLFLAHLICSLVPDFQTKYNILAYRKYLFREKTYRV